MLAAATGIAPSVLWDQDPADLATLEAVLQERANG